MIHFKSTAVLQGHLSLGHLIWEFRPAHLHRTKHVTNHPCRTHLKSSNLSCGLKLLSRWHPLCDYEGIHSPLGAALGLSPRLPGMARGLGVRICVVWYLSEGRDASLHKATSAPVSLAPWGNLLRPPSWRTPSLFINTLGIYALLGGFCAGQAWIY